MKIGILLKYFFALLLLYLFSGFFLFPSIIKQQIEKNFKNIINIEVIKFNPFNISITLDRVSIQYESKKIISISSIKFKIDPFDLLKKEVKFTDIRVDQSEIKLQKAKNGDFNFHNIFPTKGGKGIDSEWKVSVEQLILTNASIEFWDNSIEPSFTKNILVSKLHVNNLHLEEDKSATFHLQASSDKKETVAFEGRFSLKPKLHIELYIFVQSFLVEPYIRYFETANEQFDIEGKLNGSLHLQIKETKKIILKKIRLNVSKLVIKDKKKSASFAFEKIDLDIEKDFNQDIYTTHIVSTFQDKYPIQVEGTFDLNRVSANFHSNFTTALHPFESYAKNYISANISEGLIGVNLDWKIQKDRKTVQGDLWLKDLKIYSLDNVNLLLGLDSLNMNGLKADLDENNYNLGEIKVDKLELNLENSVNNRLNIVGTIKDNNTTSKTNEINFFAKSMVIENSSMSYTDKSVQPNVKTDLSEIHTEINNLSNIRPNFTDASIYLKLDNSSEANFEALYDELQGVSSTKGVISNYDIVSLSPYSTNSLGYVINKGKLNMSVDFALKDKKLYGKAKMNFDNFEVKEADVQNVKKVPLPLAIALLKDRDNQINLDTKIKGDLRDPSFSINGLISTMFIGLIEKIVTSPFAILGSLFEGDSKFRTIKFESGKADLTKEAMQVIQKVEKVLYERPNIQLEIQGQSSPSFDANALAKNNLEHLLKNEKFLKLLESDEDTLYDSVVVTPKERARWLKSIYRYFKADEQNSSEMQRYLLQKLKPTADEFLDLAFARAKEVRDELIRRSSVLKNQIYLVAADVNASSSSVIFKLK